MPGAIYKSIHGTARTEIRLLFGARGVLALLNIF